MDVLLKNFELLLWLTGTRFWLRHPALVCVFVSNP
jgi:hypothetical protein